MLETVLIVENVTTIKGLNKSNIKYLKPCVLKFSKICLNKIINEFK